MKNIYVHFVGDGSEPENVGYQFADIPRVGDFISLTDSNDSWFEVAAVVHLAFAENTRENFDFDAEIWVKKPIVPNKAIERFSR